MRTRAHTKGNRRFAPERAQSFGMCYQSATQCCRLSVFTGCSGNGYLILTLICSSFAIFMSSGDTRLEKVFKLGREKQNRKRNFPSQPPPHPTHLYNSNALSSRARPAFSSDKTPTHPLSHVRNALHSNGLTSRQILTKPEQRREGECAREAEVH